MIAVIRFLVAVVVAAMFGLAVGLPVLRMRLVVPAQVVGPLALAAGALAAALGAGWMGNLFTRDRSRLLLVVAVAGASAVVLFLVVLASAFLPGLRVGLFFGPLIYTAAVCAVCAVFVAVSAGVATLLLRGPRGRLGWDGAVALLASAAVLLLGFLAGGVGLLPLYPEWDFVTLGYGSLAWISFAFLVVGASMAAGRFSPGHELGRDAAATLALVAVILPGVIGSISFACSNLVGCSG